MPGKNFFLFLPQVQLLPSSSMSVYMSPAATTIQPTPTIGADVILTPSMGLTPTADADLTPNTSVDAIRFTNTKIFKT